MAAPVDARPEGDAIAITNVGYITHADKPALNPQDGQKEVMQSGFAGFLQVLCVFRNLRHQLGGRKESLANPLAVLLRWCRNLSTRTYKSGRSSALCSWNFHCAPRAPTVPQGLKRSRTAVMPVTLPSRDISIKSLTMSTGLLLICYQFPFVGFVVAERRSF